MTCPNCGANMEQNAHERDCLYCGYVSKIPQISIPELTEEECDDSNANYHDITTLNEEFKQKLESDEHTELKIGVISALVVTIGIVIIAAVLLFCIYYI